MGQAFEQSRWPRILLFVACAIVSALSLAAAIFEYQHIVVFTALITFCCTAVVLYGNALAGWTVDALPSSDFGWLGSFTTTFTRVYGMSPTSYRATFPPARLYPRFLRSVRRS